jgi:hypothetical protein
MNRSFNRDIKYTFAKRWYYYSKFSLKPINTILIDDDWIKEKNIVMDVIIPAKYLDQLEDDNLKHNTELKGWNDNGIDELIAKKFLSDEDFSFK